MGVRIHAFIEYDETSTPPFSVPTDSVIDFTEDTGLHAGKDHEFIAAISGFRNETGIPVAIAPRGIPDNLDASTAEHIEKYFEADDPGVGWLSLSEIDECLAHHGYSRDRLSLPVRTLLATMDFLRQQLGDDRVRLVFAISD